MNAYFAKCGRKFHHPIWKDRHEAKCQKCQDRTAREIGTPVQLTAALALARPQAQERKEG